MMINNAGLAWEVMAAFDDPATETFDAVLTAAGLDEMTARALRFWQRESVHNTKQYAASALPAVVEAVYGAQADAQAATDRGAQAWQDAGREVPARTAAAVSAVARQPEPPPSSSVTSDDLLEMRRRTVAARLAHLG